MQFDHALEHLTRLQQRLVDTADQQDWQRLAMVESECQMWMHELSEWPDLDVLQTERLRRHLLGMTAVYQRVINASIEHIYLRFSSALAG
ncbi:hypothetical protein [Gynuella sunshinyii]|uniref:Flagellar protein FliT n=1 Tax=Gynuella sunshinyii YC6258 TaxID=1445510 RepID=A0A0C5VNU6_9GAMM|nr:hypothetical protein [Gynuella sunshinyii]AJQ96347.1 hypothetical Protein YC6258_04313 [Gynuella sunshinyii YC6258]